MTSRLDIIVFTLVFFTNPLVWTRVLIQNDSLSMIIYGVLMLYVFYKALRVVRNCTHSYVYMTSLLMMLFYLAYTCWLRSSVGESFGNVIQHALMVSSSILLLFLLTSIKQQTNLIYAYVLAAMVHVVTIFPFFEGINAGLTENTAYPVGEYAIGIFDRRATGFFNSPGYLSLFAVGGLSLGLAKLKHNKENIYRVLIILSLILGFAAFSRSFLVVFAVIIMCYFIAVNIRIRLQVIAVFTLALIVLLSTETFRDYLDFVLERLVNMFDFQSNDRIKGETGILQTLRVIAHDPIFGSAISYNGGSLTGWNGEVNVKPHVGLLAILTFYGIVGAWSVYLLVLLGIGKVFKALFNGSFFKLENPFLFGFVAVNILCLVEPLVETQLYFFFLFGMFAFEHLKRKNLSMLRYYFHRLNSMLAVSN